MSAPVSSHPYWHLVLSLFYILAVLCGRCVVILTVILICISSGYWLNIFVANDVKRVFMCLFAIYVSLVMYFFMPFMFWLDISY